MKASGALFARVGGERKSGDCRPAESELRVAAKKAGCTQLRTTASGVAAG